MSLTNLLKTLVYGISPRRLPAGKRVRIGFCFHTEALYDSVYFERMHRFLQDYTAITGRKALATLMSGAHPRVLAGIREFGLTEDEFVRRLKEIGRHSDLGYHGHYGFQPERFADFRQQIRGWNYDMAAIRAQMDRELAWFAEEGITIGPYYSAGWWFQAPEMYALLAEKGFVLDASVSYAPWFRQVNSYSWFREAGVRAVEPVLIGGKVLAVQNLVGCHDSPFPDDFIRHVAELLREAPEDAPGFVHSHDFDLHPEFALKTLERLAKEGVRFADAPEFLALKASARQLSFPAGSFSANVTSLRNEARA